MALIDPCVALPFDPKTAHLADEREAQTDDQPLTPTTPTTPTGGLSSSSAFSRMTASSSLASSPHTGGSASQSGASSSPAHLTTLPTVLQSVFSYIFTDHQHNQLHLANNSHTSASSLSAPSSPAHSSLSPPPSPTAHVVSSPVTPISSASLLPFGSSPASSVVKSTRHCAILDLDETLLHSFFPDKVTPYQYQYMVMKCKAQEVDERDGRLRPHERTLYQVDVGDGTIVVLMLRPHLRPFLESLFAAYDVGVWSAGGKLYVDAICRVLFPPNSTFRPLFQLCWDDVQVETNGLSSYTKPLTTLISRFSQLSLPTLFLVDNRKENGLHFPSQLVIAPDYLPRPWEWNGDRDRDEYLHLDCMASIADCVECMRERETGRLDVGVDVEDMEEEDEEESEMGLEGEEGEEHGEEEHEHEEEEETESGVDEHEHFTSDDEAEHRATQLDSSMYDADGADELMDDEAIANASINRRQTQKTAA